MRGVIGQQHRGWRGIRWGSRKGLQEVERREADWASARPARPKRHSFQLSLPVAAVDWLRKPSKSLEQLWTTSRSAQISGATAHKRTPIQGGLRPRI